MKKKKASDDAAAAAKKPRRRAEKSTYIVESWDAAKKKFVSYKLTDWCKKSGVLYLTVISRIHRGKDPNLEPGVYFFKDTDPILRSYYGRNGRYNEPELAPRHRSENRVNSERKTHGKSKAAAKPFIDVRLKPDERKRKTASRHKKAASKGTNVASSARDEV